jgi:hypothetical protein
MFPRLTPDKHSLLARSRARSSECPDRMPASPKHPIMILLRALSGNSSGMILLQIASDDSREENVLNRPNRCRICDLVEKCARRIARVKSLRMILLQDVKNNCPEMILLQKKWGGGVLGALSVPNRPRRRSRGRAGCWLYAKS